MNNFDDGNGGWWLLVGVIAIVLIIPCYRRDLWAYLRNTAATWAHIAGKMDWR